MLKTRKPESTKRSIPSELVNSERLVDMIVYASNSNNEEVYTALVDTLDEDFKRRLPLTPFPFEDLTSVELEYILNSGEHRIREIPESFFSKLWRKK